MGHHTTQHNILFITVPYMCFDRIIQAVILLEKQNSDSRTCFLLTLLESRNRHQLAFEN